MNFGGVTESSTLIYVSFNLKEHIILILDFYSEILKEGEKETERGDDKAMNEQTPAVM